jgi:PII-like signaling protein
MWVVLEALNAASLKTSDRDRRYLTRRRAAAATPGSSWIPSAPLKKRGSEKKTILCCVGRFGPMLPKGSAKKVTIYINQDTRTQTHIEPLWSAILSFLRHKHVAGATLLRADAGFGTHEQLHDPRSEYIAEHCPVRIEFIETVERVEELLPTLYEMVTDGLITVQDLTVVKAVAKDSKAKAAQMEVRKKTVTTPAKLVRIYLGESDKCKGEPLYEAIVKKLRMMDFAGATVYRGILGYGAKGHTHKAGKFHLSHDLPVMISVVEKPERLDELVRVVAEMVQDGLIVTSDVELHQIIHELPTSGEDTSHARSAG